MNLRLTLTISFLSIINFCFSQNCNGPTFPWNLISNPGLEAGGLPSGNQDDFEQGLVDCWDNYVCEMTANGPVNVPSGGPNTPDILDANFGPSSFAPCGGPISYQFWNSN